MKVKVNYMYSPFKTINSLNQSGGGIKEAILFKADFCGHCKQFKSTWKELTNECPDIKFTTYDMNKDPKKMEEYNVEKFPTIFLKTNSDTFEHVGPRDKKTIKTFFDNFD
jgi:glutaredoxin